MSKFTKQYTTKEQSKRLLKLGIPAWTADCYYDQYGMDESPSSYTYPQWFFGGDTLEILTKRFHRKLIPCWSTGRLIELHEILFPQYKNFIIERDDIILISRMVKYYEICAEQVVLDFSKLEEYKNE